MAIGERRRTVAIGAFVALAFLFASGIREASASTGCTAVNQGQWNISANNNGSIQQDGIFAGGDSLSFTFTGFGEYSFTQALSNGGGFPFEE